MHIKRWRIAIKHYSTYFGKGRSPKARLTHGEISFATLLYMSVKSVMGIYIDKCRFPCNLRFFFFLWGAGGGGGMT